MNADGIRWKKGDQKPFGITEFGAGAQAGRHGDAMAVWSGEYRPTLPPAGGHVPAHSVPQRHHRLGAGVLPLTAPAASRNSGLRQSQGLSSDRGDRKQASHGLRGYYGSLLAP